MGKASLALVIRCLADHWFHHPGDGNLDFLKCNQQLWRMWNQREERQPLLVIELEKQHARATAHQNDMGGL